MLGEARACAAPRQCAHNGASKCATPGIDDSTALVNVKSDEPTYGTRRWTAGSSHRRMGKSIGCGVWPWPGMCSALARHVLRRRAEAEVVEVGAEEEDEEWKRVWRRRWRSSGGGGGGAEERRRRSTVMEARAT